MNLREVICRLMKLLVILVGTIAIFTYSESWDNEWSNKKNLTWKDLDWEDVEPFVEKMRFATYELVELPVATFEVQDFQVFDSTKELYLLLLTKGGSFEIWKINPFSREATRERVLNFNQIFNNEKAVCFDYVYPKLAVGFEDASVRILEFDVFAKDLELKEVYTQDPVTAVVSDIVLTPYGVAIADKVGDEVWWRRKYVWFGREPYVLRWAFGKLWILNWYAAELVALEFDTHEMIDLAEFSRIYDFEVLKFHNGDVEDAIYSLPFEDKIVVYRKGKKNILVKVNYPFKISYSPKWEILAFDSDAGFKLAYFMPEERVFWYLKNGFIASCETYFKIENKDNLAWFIFEAWRSFEKEDWSSELKYLREIEKMLPVDADKVRRVVDNRYKKIRGW